MQGRRGGSSKRQLDGWGGCARQNVPFLCALVIAHLAGGGGGLLLIC